MDTSYSNSWGGVGIETVVPILLRKRYCLQRLHQHLGLKLAPNVATVRAESLPHGQLWAEVHDFFLDEIWNESKIVWAGIIYDPDDEDNPDRRFPVQIHEYRGIFWVSALEYDDVGYFLKRIDAMDYIKCNWDHVKANR